MLVPDSILKAQNIILSTHKSSDGDGLGSEIAMYFALKKMNKNVYFVHSDLIPDRYHFLTANIPEDCFYSSIEAAPANVDLALIFDTHDPKLCSPLYERLQEKNTPVFFIDHHIKTDYKTNPANMIIDESASCTGEIVYNLIRQLPIQLDKNIAAALYASLIFDTQNFKLIRHPSKPFLMASELLSFGFDHEAIQSRLFANWNIAKMNYLSYLIGQVQYFNDQSVAVIKILKNDLKRFKVDTDQVSDLVDLFMQIDSVCAAIVVREESAAYHKLSFRCRSDREILSWARAFDGGGHNCSAGAWVETSMADIDAKLSALIQNNNLKKISSF